MRAIPQAGKVAQQTGQPFGTSEEPFCVEALVRARRTNVREQPTPF